MEWGLVLAAAFAGSACGPQISEQSQRLSQNLVALAQESYNNGDVGDAIRKSLQAAEADPQNPDATYLLGLLYASRQEWTDAERWLKKTVELDDTFTDARNTLGVVYNNQGRFAEAITVLEEAARDLIYPTPHLVLGNLGQSYLEAGQYDLAVDALRRAIREQPLFCVGYLRLGDALSRKGDGAAAEEALATAVGVDDPACQQLQPAWRLLGEVRLRGGNRDGAAEAFTRCREIDPRSDDGSACAAALAQGLAAPAASDPAATP